MNQIVTEEALGKEVLLECAEETIVITGTTIDIIGATIIAVVVEIS